jgi:hypothetical protein
MGDRTPMISASWRPARWTSQAALAVGMPGGGPVLRSEFSLPSMSNQDGAPKVSAPAVTSQPTMAHNHPEALYRPVIWPADQPIGSPIFISCWTSLRTSFGRGRDRWLAPAADCVMAARTWHHTGCSRGHDRVSRLAEMRKVAGRTHNDFQGDLAGAAPERLEFDALTIVDSDRFQSVDINDADLTTLRAFLRNNELVSWIDKARQKQRFSSYADLESRMTVVLGDRAFLVTILQDQTIASKITFR